ncbi:hypothetical protein R1sor_011884 [Riccia sorocarpa]|uniref:Reverse transcriptase domain-containing protein n=1 Tax=Riccia sorocarpa TaxID=122646 RepID=A0ABD3I2K6_9MARC
MIVPHEQQGFISGRTVQNNVLFFCFLHEALKRERKYASFLMLDFAKAFDSLRHDFIFMALEMLGFSPFFVRLIKTITTGGFACVIVNNRMTAEFPLEKGVRQGCPLAPLLYLLTTSALIFHARHHAEQSLLEMVKLRALSEPIPVVSAFANDTTFILETTPQSFRKLFRLLDDFYLASGYRVNWEKTIHLALGKSFQKALLAKYLLADLECRGSMWGKVLWSSLQRTHSGPKFKFLFFPVPSPTLTLSPFTKFVFSICQKLRKSWVWKPVSQIMPTEESISVVLYLLNKGAFIDNDRFLQLNEQLWNSLGLPLRECHGSGILSLFPELDCWEFTLDTWEFRPADWKLFTLVTGKVYGFPLPVAAIYRTFQELRVPGFSAALSSRWLEDFQLSDWHLLFSRLWSAGLHRRNALFLWRILIRGFFTGRRAALLGVSDGTCAFCLQHQEDLSHLLFLCPEERLYWLDAARVFPSILEFCNVLWQGGVSLWQFISYWVSRVENDCFR